MIDWQHLPCAIWPLKDELNCASGDIALTQDGTPCIMYTSVPAHGDFINRAELWIAEGSTDMIHWNNSKRHKILDASCHNKIDLIHWRDPFFVRGLDRHVMILGAQHRNGNACVPLYDSENLYSWNFRGIVYEIDSHHCTIECPTMLILDDKYVLIYSVLKFEKDRSFPLTTKYVVGTLNHEKNEFIFLKEGRLDLGHTYTTSCLIDKTGRRLMWGWVPGFVDTTYIHGKGWSGCLTMPRELTLNSRNELQQEPAREMKLLRSKHFRLNCPLVRETILSQNMDPHKIEVLAKFHPFTDRSFEMKICGKEQTSEGIKFKFCSRSIQIDRECYTLEDLEDGAIVELHLFVDNSLVEVFINCRLVVTMSIPFSVTMDRVVIQASSCLASLDIWNLLKSNYSYYNH